MPLAFSSVTRLDFESWAPKLSDRAIVLFHDVAERRADFGVWKLWAELRRDYPSFECEHSHGLGVLQVGRAHDGPALPLFRTTDPVEIATIRARFAALGDAVRMVARATELYMEVEQLRSIVGRGGAGG